MGTLIQGYHNAYPLKFNNIKRYTSTKMYKLMYNKPFIDNCTPLTIKNYHFTKSDFCISVDRPFTRPPITCCLQH